MNSKNKNKAQKLSKASISTLMDQVDEFKAQLIAEKSNLNQYEFDLAHVIDLVKIKKKQTLKKIERLNSNIAVLEKEIKKSFRAGGKIMAEEEETKEEAPQETEESSEPTKTETSE